MLEKQADNMNVEKLQIILLFKGNFNQNNKWLGWAVAYVQCRTVPPDGTQTVWQPKRKVGGYTMPQQMIVIQLC